MYVSFVYNNVRVKTVHEHAKGVLSNPLDKRQFWLALHAIFLYQSNVKRARARASVWSVLTGAYVWLYVIALDTSASWIPATR